MSYAPRQWAYSGLILLVPNISKNVICIVFGIFNKPLLMDASCFSVSVFQISATPGFFIMYMSHISAFHSSLKIFADLSSFWAGTRCNSFYLFIFPQMGSLYFWSEFWFQEIPLQFSSLTTKVSDQWLILHILETWIYIALYQCYFPHFELTLIYKLIKQIINIYQINV